MKISRIILEGVNNFEDFNRSFEDDWTKTVPDSLLLIGPNGSGKTTLIKSIEGLWIVLRAFLTTPPEVLDSTDYHSDIVDKEQWGFAAMEIKGLLSAPLLITIGQQQDVRTIFDDYPDSYRIGAIWCSEKSGSIPGNIKWRYEPPGKANGKTTNASQPWVEKLQNRYEQNVLGAIADLPNMVVFESENRTLEPIEEEFSASPEQEVFRWRVFYEPTTGRKGSIENYLFTLKAVDPGTYERLVAEINEFLVDKKISGFHRTTKRLMVETKSSQSHPVHLLSSGEKQILLMLAFITRWFRPGGILLIDEPDLHLHVSLSNAFVSHLRQLVAGQNGQLIIASHAPELWERFVRAERVELGLLTEVRG